MPMIKLVAPLATTMISLAWPTAAGMVLLAALIGMVYNEQKFNEAICRAKIQEQVIKAARAELSEVKDELHASQTKPTSTDLCLVDTKSLLANTEIALKQSEKKVVAHLEFRDGLGRELSQARRERDRAEGVMVYLTHALEESKCKNASKEDECYELQSQIQFKAKELQSMTLSLHNTMKELERANKFSQEAQDKIDEQHATIMFNEESAKRVTTYLQAMTHSLHNTKKEWERANKFSQEAQDKIDEQHATIMSNEESAKRVSTQIEKLTRDCNALKSQIRSLHLGWTSRCDESWRVKKALEEENRQLRIANESWAKNNAGTIRAMQSRVDELEGELAECRAENGCLAVDLEIMVERVAHYMEEIEALDREAEEREWNFIPGEMIEAASETSESITDEEEEDYEGYEPEGYRLWTFDGDSEDDATVYELDEDSEEEMPEWFIHAPTDPSGMPYKQMWEMTNVETEGLKEWDEDSRAVANGQEKNDVPEYLEGLEEQHTDDDTLSQSDDESLDPWDADDEDWSGSAIKNNTPWNSYMKDTLDEEDEDWGIVHTWDCEPSTVDCEW
ncbi:uncharacterized protein J4E84_006012 [Alternaria hordeiaustralica]|uniref:uncharacterized protein n=1 Tax=Alternaria hordeiaustralica TaxID=1187925 RepID=UPI0020C237DD|nr:uncharacterized protein J4E84_006012 [Alternaria hordeiaustralica]KAI4685285.1 hypothetical protein J4E84_006012 [Alternaria hordeiaustralica]